MNVMDEIVSMLEKHAGDEWEITEIAETGNGLWVSAIINKLFDVFIITDTYVSIEEQILNALTDEDEEQIPDDEYDADYDDYDYRLECLTLSERNLGYW